MKHQENWPITRYKTALELALKALLRHGDFETVEQALAIIDRPDKHEPLV